MRWMKTVSDEEIREGVAQVVSMKALLQRLEVNTQGSNYTTARKRIHALDLDTSHWSGSGHLKGKHHNWATRIPLEKLLVEHSTYGRGHLKRRLIQEGILPNRCSNPECRVDATWLGKPLALVLDHLNGVGDDHRLENLRLLCPNCNSQTETFCGRNITYQRRTTPKCPTCGTEVSAKGRKCLKCAASVRSTRG